MNGPSGRFVKLSETYDSIGDKLVFLDQALPPGNGTSEPGPCILRHSEKYIARERARFIALGIGANPTMARVH